MTFVSALFLLGALGVAGPVVVHLLARPKYKRLPFTMLQFLREGQSESQARRRIRDWIILLLRCAIIALLAVLFARPLWQTRVPREPASEVWFVGVDTSLSMTFKPGKQDLFTQMKTQVKDVIRESSNDSEFHVFAAGQSQWHRHVNKAQALAWVHGLEPARSAAQFDEFVSTVQRQCGERDEDTRVHVVLASDFAQDVLMNLRSMVNPACVDDIEIVSVQPDEQAENSGIVNASVAGVTDGQAQIYVTLRNTGSSPVQRTLQGHGCEPQDVTLEPERTCVCTVTCSLPTTTSGQYPVILSLSGHDSFQADDTLTLKVAVSEHVTQHVLLVDDTTTDRLFLFKTAIESLEDVSSNVTWETRCVTTDQLERTDLVWANTVVLAGMSPSLKPWLEELKRGVNQGKRLVCFTTDTPDASVLSQADKYGLWPVAWEGTSKQGTFIESQPIPGPWTHARAGDSLVQYGVNRMAVTCTETVHLKPEAHCVWRFQNDVPFVAAQSAEQGVALWVNTSVDPSRCTLVKSPAAVAWAQFLIASGSRDNGWGQHEAWRDCEPLVNVTPQARIDEVVHALFTQEQPLTDATQETSYATRDTPLWRHTAWLLLILIVAEPFVAHRMKP